MQNRIKYKEIPKVKSELLIKQNYKCLVCKRDLRNFLPKMQHLHHNHESGFIVGVLCGHCNQFEGRALNWYVRTGLKKSGVSLVDIYGGLISMYKKKETKLIHPTHKTEDEKKKLRLARARRKRKKSKNNYA